VDAKSLVHRELEFAWKLRVIEHATEHLYSRKQRSQARDQP
jgi:hypothetical protein